MNFPKTKQRAGLASEKQGFKNIFNFEYEALDNLLHLYQNILSQTIEKGEYAGVQQ